MLPKNCEVKSLFVHKNETLALSQSRERMFNMGRAQVHSRLSSIENVSAGSLKPRRTQHSRDTLNLKIIVLTYLIKKRFTELGQNTTIEYTGFFFLNWMQFVRILQYVSLHYYCGPLAGPHFTNVGATLYDSMDCSVTVFVKTHHN